MATIPRDETGTENRSEEPMGADYAGDKTVKTSKKDKTEARRLIEKIQKLLVIFPEGEQEMLMDNIGKLSEQEFMTLLKLDLTEERLKDLELSPENLEIVRQHIEKEARREREEENRQDSMERIKNRKELSDERKFNDALDTLGNVLIAQTVVDSVKAPINSIITMLNESSKDSGGDYRIFELLLNFFLLPITAPLFLAQKLADNKAEKHVQGDPDRKRALDTTRQAVEKKEPATKKQKLNDRRAGNDRARQSSLHQDDITSPDTQQDSVGR